MQIRHPIFAGTFYNTNTLRQQVNSFLPALTETATLKPKAIIVPHAGYVYSGPIAGTAYCHTKILRGSIKNVVVLGPSHRLPFAGVALASYAKFSTPLGDITVSHEYDNQLLKLKNFKTLDSAHSQEHSIEVQLPFLQVTLDNFQLIPLVVGSISGSELADALDILWEDNSTLIVISSDLSHYHSYDEAVKIDHTTITAIENMNPQAISVNQACGRLPILGIIEFAQRHKWQVKLLDLRNSGDTAGDRQKVVGYAAMIYT